MASSDNKVAAGQSPRIALFDRSERAVPYRSRDLAVLLPRQISTTCYGRKSASNPGDITPDWPDLGMTLAGHRRRPRDYPSGPCHHIFFTSSPRYEFANVLFSTRKDRCLRLRRRAITQGKFEDWPVDN